MTPETVFLAAQLICLAMQFRAKSRSESVFWFGCVFMLMIAVLAAVVVRYDGNP